MNIQKQKNFNDIGEYNTTYLLKMDMVINHGNFNCCM